VSDLLLVDEVLLLNSVVDQRVLDEHEAHLGYVLDLSLEFGDYFRFDCRNRFLGCLRALFLRGFLRTKAGNSECSLLVRIL